MVNAIKPISGTSHATLLANRCGAALLICLFVMALTTALVVSVLDSLTLEMTASRNTVYYEQALYLAGAAAHHALAELEDNPNWRSGIPSTEFPSGSGNTYSASVVDGNTGQVIVTAVGSAGSVTRKLQVTVEL